MEDTEPTEFVQTITGQIDPEELGLVMMHEHLFVASGVYFKEPEDPAEAELSRQPVALDNLWWIRYNSKSNRDNLSMEDPELAVREAQMLVDAGGQTFVDLTPTMRGENVPGLLRVAEETGLNIVKGCGYYIEGSYPAGSNVENRSVDDLTTEIVNSITVGDPITGIRAGIIGEIGCSWPLTPLERKVLRAAGQAQVETGVTLNVHPGRNDAALPEIRDILAAESVDLTRTVISHMDRSGYELSTRRDVLDSGCKIEYDLFGQEGYYPAHVTLAENTLPDMPNDLGRILQIIELHELGYGAQVLMSHDICMKMSLAAYGGYGYGHILRNVVPLMKIYGLGQAEIDLMLKDTPKALLTISR